MFLTLHADLARLLMAFAFPSPARHTRQRRPLAFVEWHFGAEALLGLETAHRVPGRVERGRIELESEGLLTNRREKRYIHSKRSGIWRIT